MSDGEIDQFQANGSTIRSAMAAMQRSIRASIARSRRLDQSGENASAHAYVDNHEHDIQMFGLAVGAASARMRQAETQLIGGDLEVPIQHFRSLLVVLWHINESSSTVWRTSRRWGNTFDVLLELHAQALMTSEEAFMLIESGYPIAAEVRWRTLFELEAVAEVLSVGDDLAARLYKVSHVAEMHRRLPDLDLLPTLGADNLGVRDYEATVRKAFAGISDRYSARQLQPYGWLMPFFGETKKRFTFRDVWDVARRALDEDDELCLEYMRYVHASQHGHGVRASSTATLAKRTGPTGPTFVPAGGGLYSPAEAVNRSIMRITRILCDVSFELFESEESHYWCEVAAAVSLDVSTELMARPMEVQQGFSSSLWSIVPRGRSTWR